MVKPIRILIAAIGLGAATGLLAEDAAKSQTHALQTVSPWVQRATHLGPADSTRRVLLTAYLSWKSAGALEQLVREQTSPGSPRYGQFLSPEEFHAQFSPHAEDVQRVQRGLSELGFRVEYTPDSGLFVRASGTVEQVRQAFHVSQDLYAWHGRVLRAHAEEPLLPATLQGIVTYLAGLDDSRMLMRPLHVSRARNLERADGTAASTADSSSSSPQPPFGFAVPFPCSHYWGDQQAVLQGPAFPYGTTLPWLPCGYTPQQIRQAYGASRVEQTGRGVRVAIADLYASPTLLADVNRFSANHGLPPLTAANFRELLAPNVNAIPTGDPCIATSWLGEQTLDVTAVHAMAPEASILYVGGACDTVDMADGGVAIEPLYEVIDHHLADIISNSWLYKGEADVAPAQLFTDNLQFLQAAVEGISVVFASGDAGDLTQQSFCFGGSEPIASGSWPSTSPLVTSVGGTSVLLLNDQGDKAEYGWASYSTGFANTTISSDGSLVTEQGFAPMTYICSSGGGPSLVMPEPFYQLGVVPARLATHTVTAAGQVVPLNPPARVTPDVAMLADTDEGLLVGETYLISQPPVDAGCTAIQPADGSAPTTEYCEQPDGGTSLATPLFAGMLALVNEARRAQHRSPVGFVNPLLYSLEVGQNPGDDTPLIDVNAPHRPQGGLVGALGFTFVGFGAIDSTIDANGNVIENVDTSLRSAPGYDAVTGRGAPNAPAFIRELTDQGW
jgi:subtilase family serine protease